MVGAARADVVPGVSPTGDGGADEFGRAGVYQSECVHVAAGQCGAVWGCAVGSVVGPGTDAVSLSLIKSIKITEQLQFQFGAQAANAFNHRNYDVPNMSVDDQCVWDDFRVAERGRGGSAERGDHGADQLLRRGSGRKGGAGAASPFSVLWCSLVIQSMRLRIKAWLDAESRNDRTYAQGEKAE